MVPSGSEIREVSLNSKTCCKNEVGNVFTLTKFCWCTLERWTLSPNCFNTAGHLSPVQDGWLQPPDVCMWHLEKKKNFLYKCFFTYVLVVGLNALRISLKPQCLQELLVVLKMCTECFQWNVLTAAAHYAASADWINTGLCISAWII